MPDDPNINTMWDHDPTTDTWEQIGTFDPDVPEIPTGTDQKPETD